MRASQKALQEALKLLWSGSRVLGRAGPCSKENKVFWLLFFFLSLNDMELCQPLAGSGLEGAPGMCSKCAELARLRWLLSGLQCGRATGNKSCAQVGSASSRALRQRQIRSKYLFSCLQVILSSFQEHLCS